MPVPKQPIARALLPDLTDADLRGAWLNAQTALDGLGADFSAAGDDMTPVGAPGTIERAGAHFTAASTQYLRRVEADWRAGDSAGTITAWIKLDAIGVIHTIFCSADEGGSIRYFYFFVHSTNLIQVGQRNGDVADNIRGSTTINADQWYHVALVSNDAAWALYVNGSIETPSIIGGANNGDWLAETDDRDSVVIGVLQRNTSTSYFDGSIMDVRYYSRVLTADEIAYEYKRGVPDVSLSFHTIGGDRDLTRYEQPITNWNNVTVGSEMRFAGAAPESLETTALELTGGMTVSLWFNADALASTVLFNDVIHLNRRLVIKTELLGEMRAGYWTGAVYRAASGTCYEANRWHHVYCTWDADETCRLWVDSVEQTGGVDPSSGNGIALRLGASTGGTSPFAGRMRDVRVWQADKGEAFGQLLDRAQRPYY